MSTDAGTRRALRDRPLGKAALLLGVLLLAVAASRSCASSEGQISKEEAIEIAKREVAYEPERTQVRLIRRGLPQSRPFWAVSLSTLDSSGRLDEVTVVVVDAQTRAVDEIRQSGR